MYSLQEWSDILPTYIHGLDGEVLQVGIVYMYTGFSQVIYGHTFI